jgi:outer membrane biosynthesis protein TonB
MVTIVTSVIIIALMALMLTKIIRKEKKSGCCPNHDDLLPDTKKATWEWEPVISEEPKVVTEEKIEEPESPIKDSFIAEVPTESIILKKVSKSYKKPEKKEIKKGSKKIEKKEPKKVDKKESKKVEKKEIKKVEKKGSKKMNAKKGKKPGRGGLLLS